MNNILTLDMVFQPGADKKEKFSIESDIPEHLHYDIVSEVFNELDGGFGLIFDSSGTYKLKILWNPVFGEFSVENDFDNSLLRTVLKTYLFHNEKNSIENYQKSLEKSIMYQNQ